MMDISLEYDVKLFKPLICVKVGVTINLPSGMVNRFVPKQTYLLYHHTGILQDIVQTFREMYISAKEQGYKSGHFKIDYGYTNNEIDDRHDLYVQLIESSI